MVLKASKRGVYSGNTLRASNSRYSRLYRTNGCIVRRCVRNPETKTTRGKSMIDVFDIGAFDVEFSLNKKERWVLPEAIRKHIQVDETPDEFTKMKTDIVIRHKLKRPANCLAYYANKGPLKRLVPKGGRYFDGKSATNFKTNPKKAVNQRAEVGDVEKTEEIVIPDETIRYEVFLPCSRFSSIVHNPKYIKPVEAEDKSTSFGGGRKKKKRTGLTSKDIDEMLEYSDPRDDDILDFETRNEETEVAADNPWGKFTLRDFLKPERKRKRKSQRRLGRESDHLYRRKNRVVYVDDNSETLITESSDVILPSLKDLTTVYPVTVKLNAKEVTADRLQTTYGAHFVEAKCEPHKFSIDITDKVREHVRSSKHFRDITSSSLELRCYLNFTELGQSPDDESFDESIYVYNVGLNLASNMNTTKLENILEMETYSISEIETKTMCYIDMLPREVFVKRETPDRFCEPIMKFELVNKAMKWNVKCIHPQDFGKNISAVVAPNAEDINCEFPSKFCNICYDEIKTDSNENDMKAPATCLNACGHWFCDRCWREHLVSKIRAGSRQLTCPEYECGSTLDFATLLSFLHISDIQKNMARQEGEKINCSAKAMWCPMPQCGRAIWAETADDKVVGLGSVVCQCGVDLCFACIRNAHWPATCDQAKRFREKMIALMDFVDFPKNMFLEPLPDFFTVKGKSCPKCKRFIEKVDGCNTMNCPCGVSFCWNCVQEVVPYSRHQCVLEHERELAVPGESYDPRLKRTRFYITALEHRKLRLYPKFCKLRSRAFALSKRLAVIAAKDTHIQQQICNLKETDNRSPQSKICKFMMHMLSTKLELHHVIEHIAVAIDGMPHGVLRYKLQKVLTNMKSHVHNIGTILERGNQQDFRNVLPHLQKVLLNSQRSVSNLSRLMSPVVKD